MVAPGAATAYVWLGSDSNDNEQDYAKKLGAVLCPEAAVNVFKEGEETDDFWEVLGGKGEYLHFKELGIAPGFEARLYGFINCVAQGGALWMEEIPNFS